MRLEIQNVAAHQVRIAQVDAFLADALVAECSYDEFFRSFALSLQRIGYEFRARKLKLGWLSAVWAMPRVPAILLVAPVEIVEVIEHRKPRHGVETLEWIAVAPGPEVELRTSIRTVVLRCLGASALRLADTSGPAAGTAVFDLGRGTLSAELIAELVRFGLPGAVAADAAPLRPANTWRLVRMPSGWAGLVRFVLLVCGVGFTLIGFFAAFAGAWRGLVFAAINAWFVWSLWQRTGRGEARFDAEVHSDADQEASAATISSCPGCSWECFNGNATKCAKCGSRLVCGPNRTAPGLRRPS